jgi:hypothetical protein
MTHRHFFAGENKDEDLIGLGDPFLQTTLRRNLICRPTPVRAVTAARLAVFSWDARHMMDLTIWERPGPADNCNAAHCA